jgi:hypothetical protein
MAAGQLGNYQQHLAFDEVREWSHDEEGVHAIGSDVYVLRCGVRMRRAAG